MTTPVRDPSVDFAPDDIVARGWNVVVWNDPVNLMDYVVWVFRRLFGFPETKATELMLAVHHEGRAIVATEPRERAEMDVYQLHRHGLWATMEEA